MAEPARKLWSLDEFLAFDDGTDTRYELFGGEIVAMTPPSDTHSVLAGRLAVVIGGKLRRPCDIALEAGVTLPDRSNTYYQADLVISCAPRTGEPVVSEPIVIVEILSPSTATTDRGRKLPDYREIPSVKEILLVSSTERHVEYWRRAAGEWTVRELRDEGSIQLQSFEITIGLTALYEDLLPAESAA